MSSTAREGTHGVDCSTGTVDAVKPPLLVREVVPADHGAIEEMSLGVYEGFDYVRLTAPALRVTSWSWAVFFMRQEVAVAMTMAVNLVSASPTPTSTHLAAADIAYVPSEILWPRSS